MTKALLLITISIILVNRMVNFDVHSHFYNLLQKSLRYHHHRENYIQSLREGVKPTGLVKMKPVHKTFQIMFFSKYLYI